MIRLVGLGVAAVVALGALNKHKSLSRKKTHRVVQQESQNPVVSDAHAPATWPSPTEVKPAAPPKTAISDGTSYVQLAQLFLRLVISLLVTALLHVAMGRNTPWSSLILTSLALFVLTEHMQKGSSPEAATTTSRQTAKVEQPPVQVPLQDFSGLWIKDKEASDSMDAVCSLMKMNALLRTAIRLIKGLRIRQGNGEFEMAVLSGILWFKIIEKYSLDGSPSMQKRRDLRKGRHTASVHPLPDSSLQMRLSWPEPCGGVGTDTFRCPTPGLLWVDSVLTVGGQTVQFRQVYRKQQ